MNIKNMWLFGTFIKGIMAAAIAPFMLSFLGSVLTLDTTFLSLVSFGLALVIVTYLWHKLIKGDMI